MPDRDGKRGDIEWIWRESEHDAKARRYGMLLASAMAVLSGLFICWLVVKVAGWISLVLVIPKAR